MPIVILTHWTQKFSTPGEQGFLGITMMLVGVILVFLILVLISLIVSIMSKLIAKNRKDDSDKAEPEIKAVQKKKNEKPVLTKQSAASPSGGQDPAIIAVIAAAVQAMLANDTSSASSAGFRIRRIRRV